MAWRRRKYISTKDHRLNEIINEWINDKDVYRTAPATPGLLVLSPISVAGESGWYVAAIGPK